MKFYILFFSLACLMASAEAEAKLYVCRASVVAAISTSVEGISIVIPASDYIGRVDAYLTTDRSAVESAALELGRDCYSKATFNPRVDREAGAAICKKVLIRQPGIVCNSIRYLD